MPSSLTTWATWREAYPETTVCWPEWDEAGRYKRRPYDPYFGSDLLRFPVEPLPDDGEPLKTRVVALREPAGEWHQLAVDELLLSRFEGALPAEAEGPSFVPPEVREALFGAARSICDVDEESGSSDLEPAANDDEVSGLLPGPSPAASVRLAIGRAQVWARSGAR